MTTTLLNRPAVIIEGIPATVLAGHWNEAAELLRSAVEGSAGRMTMEKLRAAIEARDMQLWAAFDQSKIIGAWVSTITIYPGAKVCELLFVGGADIQSWLDMGLDMVEAWAEAHGCDSVTIVGRKGWGRITEHRGYGHFATIIEKRLDDG